jgi:hypothetical protein
MDSTIQTAGTFDGEYYSLIIGFRKSDHAITLDGLSKGDMLELKSCIDCMLLGEEDCE